ncbi:MAG: hypothetical protein AB2L11_00475 [Syntrophobacteraceae bacterium]
MRYFYGKFMSLFPLMTGAAILWIGIESAPVVKLAPGIEVSREFLIGIGGAFIALALVMMVLARYVEMAMIKCVNLILPSALRLEPEPPAPKEARIEDLSQTERKILKQGKGFEMDSDYVLNSHVFTIKEGLLIGVLCLLPATVSVATSWATPDFPDMGLLSFGLLLLGLALFSKRTDIMIDGKTGILTDHRKVLGASVTQKRDLGKFDRIVIKKRRWFGMASVVQASSPGSLGFGTIYLVQLGGAGLTTVNFYLKYEEAQQLGWAIAEVTRLPMVEAQ